jgi:hypothetical protein
VFAATVMHRPRGRYTIRQRCLCSSSGPPYGSNLTNQNVYNVGGSELVPKGEAMSDAATAPTIACKV